MIDPNDFDEYETEFGCALCPATRRTRRELAIHVMETHAPAPEPLAHPNAARFTSKFTRRQRDDSVAAGLEAAQKEIADLKSSVNVVAERMKALDAADAARNRVRLETLREVSQMLYSAGELTASKMVMDVIRKEI